jgi:hypothetical protein
MNNQETPNPTLGLKLTGYKVAMIYADSAMEWN